MTVSLAAGYFYRHASATTLTEKDTVVLADFDNKTADSVFDGTLRQELFSRLERSPFMNLLSDTRIDQTLALGQTERCAIGTGAGTRGLSKGRRVQH